MCESEWEWNMATKFTISRGMLSSFWMCRNWFGHWEEGEKWKKIRKENKNENWNIHDTLERQQQR